MHLRVVRYIYVYGLLGEQVHLKLVPSLELQIPKLLHGFGKHGLTENLNLNLQKISF